MTDPLAPFVDRRGAAILDGGLATELERRGVDLLDPLWSARALLDAPEIVEAVHRDYLEAGADVISTATYQATLPGLVARGLTDEKASRLLHSGAALAWRARDVFWAQHAKRGGRLRPLVAASIGSFGAYLADGSEYRGGYDLSEEALSDWHRPRLRILEATGVDLIAFETMPSLPEVGAIVRILGESAGPPVWISFQARDAERLADGSAIEDAAALAERCPRVVAIGVNCVPPWLVEPLLKTLATATAKPLAVYPNRGDAWDAASRSWIASGVPVDLGASAPAWRDAGARLIGGCCRTTPDDIRAIAASL